MISSLQMSGKFLQRRAEINDNVSGLNTPVVSTAIGWKEWEGSIVAYFPFFLVSAMAATAPDSFVALARYEGAKVSVQVASHTSNLPRSQGTSVMPSLRQALGETGF